MSDAIRPYRIEVPDPVLEDLKRRLATTRWPERAPVDDWSQGTPLEYLQAVCATWATEYDWRATEARLNRLPQFMTAIDGVDIHFLHLRSQHADALPLVMTHGWPGSIIEFLKVVDPLVNPTAHGAAAADAFHLVLPTLPGYGFSAKPAQTGWGVERIARAWSTLMQRLGYASYVAQGGDWGASVSTWIGLQDPDHCRGIHLNMPIVAVDKTTLADLTPLEKSALEGRKHYSDWDSGYSKEQSTRPQTVGYGLVDSPAGLAAWILEKFYAWTDCDGHPENVVARSALLDNLMLYWLPGTGASSARLYWESFARTKLDPVRVPSGVSLFPKEIFRASRRWVEKRYTNLVYWNELPRGGHFAAFELPEVFVRELRACFRQMR
jgi:pimeloyl-ACP methyl ester carboxylesterase